MKLIHFRINTVLYFVFVFLHRCYSAFGHMGWVGGVPPRMLLGSQTDSAEPPLRDEDCDEVINSSHE